MAEAQRVHVEVQGVVQGVGFRPFIFDLASRSGLSGWVLNTSDGVTLEVQGNGPQVDAFVRDFVQEAPPLAFIVEVQVANVVPIPGEDGFEIRASRALAQRSALLPPDVCICDDCLRELLDPSDRRHRYPFINCTNCGPRYTIIHDVPYDRDKTSMASFAMCEACRREYEDPRDRRFHAQPNACFACGPRMWLADAAGRSLVSEDPIRQAAAWLRNGKIMAVKGLGGFHLAVDATHAGAVKRLRERKQREAKPLAIMCRDLAEARRHAHIDDHALALLSSRHRPIVLVPKTEGSTLAANVAPDNADIGVMLPYTPLHVLLLGDGPATLVMTSGNLSEEPIAIGNEEAIERLGAIADVFLLHDREILVRNDDSVVGAVGARTTFFRRSRGYVPLPVMLRDDGACALGVGAELKSTVCLTRGRMAFSSQHVGDLSNEPAVDAFVDAVEHLQRVVGARPACVGVDLHPDYASTRWAESLDVPRFAVQHHHAHIAACLAEHQEPGPAIGIALDGVGLGTDGAVWGGEVLLADLVSFRRVGHLGYVRMPGGDQASRQPWRMAVSYLMDAYGEDWRRFCPEALRSIDEGRREAVAGLVQRGVHAPLTSSTGRLFDGMAALCGLFLEARFEAQAAMGLEMAARRGVQDETVWPVDLGVHDMLCIPPADFVRCGMQDLAAGVSVPVVAMRFHRTLATALVEACVRVRERTGCDVVAAGGGSLQNRVLSWLLIEGLEKRGFRVLVPERLPPGDGGIALGQAVVARARMEDSLAVNVSATMSTDAS